MPPSLALAAIVLLVPCIRAQHATNAPAALTADIIMARVAAHQDASEAARLHVIYVQHVRISSRNGKTVRCEEVTDARVTPVAAGSDHLLLKLDGRVLQKGRYVTYHQLPSGKSTETAADAGEKDLSIHLDDQDDAMDRDLVENMRHNLTAGSSKDGIAANLFPLTSSEQADYTFTLLGRELRNGRDCFHIRFLPKDSSGFGWKGEAWIDASAFEPVLIRTTLSRKVPFAVRLLLGTNVTGLGFTIVYAPQEIHGVQTEGSVSGSGHELWFPSSFGTEFKLHVLFFFRREIVFNAENLDFQSTHTSGEIVGGGDALP